MRNGAEETAGRHRRLTVAEIVLLVALAAAAVASFIAPLVPRDRSRCVTIIGGNE